MSKLKELNDFLKERGFVWTILFVNRHILKKRLNFIESRLISIEKKRRITGKKTISAQYHTRDINRKFYDNYDWSDEGEEWSRDVIKYKNMDPQVWKKKLIQKMLKKYISKGSVVLEIGPGGGRWSNILKTRSSRLILADISKNCLQVCKKRFEDEKNIDYFLIKDGKLDFIEEGSLHHIWAYDVFVHINPTEIEEYVKQFRKLLKKNGVAVIHHSGTYESEADAGSGFRSHMDKDFFKKLVVNNGMKIIEQNTELPHKPGDVISVFKK